MVDQDKEQRAEVQFELPSPPPADTHLDVGSSQMKASADVPYWGEQKLKDYARQAFALGRQQQKDEVEWLWATFIKLSDYLGIDPESARKEPGKPSDVFIRAIERGRQKAALNTSAQEAMEAAYHAGESSRAVIKTKEATLGASAQGVNTPECERPK